MLADPQSVTIGGVANSLAAVVRGTNTSQYAKDDGASKLTISHAYAKRNRRTVRLDLNKIAPDALTAVNSRLSASTYIVIDAPIDGFSVTELKDAVVALATWLTASSAANTVKVLGGES